MGYRFLKCGTCEYRTKDVNFANLAQNRLIESQFATHKAHCGRVSSKTKLSLRNPGRANMPRMRQTVRDSG